MLRTDFDDRKESRREPMLEAVACAAERLLRSKDRETEIDDVLAELSRAAAASRSYIIRCGRDESGALCGTCTYEWVTDRVESHLGDPDPAGPPYEEEGCGRWLAELAAGRVIAGEVGAFPAPERAHLEARGIRSLAMVPITMSGELWGFLRFDQTGDGRCWSDGEIGVLRAAAGILGAAIGSQRVEESRRAIDEALRMSEQRFSTMFEMSPLPICVTAFDDGRILDVNQSLLEDLGYTRDQIVGKTTREIGLWVDSRRRDEMFEALRTQGSVSDFHAECHTRTGRRLVWKVFAERLTIGGRDCLLSVCHDHTEREEIENRLHYLAYHDPLTGLPNRAAFEEALTAALAKRPAPGSLALLFVDLDRFKVVNDSLGHTAGDRLLTRVAERLPGAVGGERLIARLGGDEFAILLPEHGDLDTAARLARTLLTCLREPITLDGHDVRLTASIGLVVNETGHEHTADLLRFADVAMARAKRGSGSCVEIFDVTRDVLETERLQLEGDLWRATEAGELVLHFQPIHRLASGEVWGAEALLRWQHPVRGLISPAELIPLAEESGAILPIGDWVLAEACRQAVRWQRDEGRPDLRIAVNVSARQLRDPGFPLRIRRLIAGTGIDPKTVLLELSENAMLKGVDEIEALRAAGVRTAIDDFGSGHASLAYLKRLPIDVLKVDRAFIRDLPESKVDATILESLQLFCANVGLAAVAEGIETPAQADLLARLGYPLGQGYHFASPMPAEEFGEYLRRHRVGAAGLPRLLAAG